MSIDEVNQTKTTQKIYTQIGTELVILNAASAYNFMAAPNGQWYTSLNNYFKFIMAACSMVTYPLNSMFLCNDNGYSSVSAPFKFTGR